MSTQKLFQNSLTIALTLTLANIAAARQPQALVEMQERTSAVVATCPDSEARTTGGYRDMLARTAPAARVMQAVAVVPPSRKMGNHLVLLCEGGEVHQGSGYRDFPARLQPEDQEPQIARAPSLTGVR